MNTKLFFTLIVIIGFILRFYQLGEVPIGFHKDEAFLGYNAYSILKTGKDINGNALPLHLQSFLYSPAGYSYASIPFIAIFKLNPFSVRAASAFFGSATILIAFFLVLVLFSQQKNRTTLALASSFFLAISPWHINLSRTATENTLVVFFIALGTLLYLVWLNQKKFYVLLAAFLSFAFTLIIYQAPRAFLPLFVPLLVIVFWNTPFQRKNIAIIDGLFLILIIVPLVFILKSPQLSTRIKTVSVFATEETQLVIDEQIRGDGVFGIKPGITRIFHNKAISYGQQITKNYFSHFTYDFLFTENAFPKRYRIPQVGILYYFELPLLLFGMWSLLQKNRKTGIFLAGWILLSPVGAALTFDDIPNMQRTLLVFPAISMVAGFGLVNLLSFFSKHRFYGPILILGSFIVLFNIFFYFHQYYVHSVHQETIYRSEGYNKLVMSVNKLLPNYEKVVVTDRESSPTIFFLFFGMYDPKTFQDETKNTTFRDFDRIGFGKYEFSQEECPLKINTGKKNTLYVNSGLCKDEKGIRILSEIKRPDNSVAFKIVAL